jgi:hypothetical protein
MSILVYFDTPIPINDLFLDDLVIINARWFQYEASETHKPLRHLSASSGTLQAYWLPVIPTANANIVISLGENVVLPPGNTVANFTSVFVPPGAVTSPGKPVHHSPRLLFTVEHAHHAVYVLAAFSSIQGPSTHDGEPFEVVVQFTKDVPEFTEDFVEVLSGGSLFPCSVCCELPHCGWMSTLFLRVRVRSRKRHVPSNLQPDPHPVFHVRPRLYITPCHCQCSDCSGSFDGP